MSETTAPEGIFHKLAKITADIGAIGKTNKNSFQNYNFRSVGQAMAALQPLLVKYNVVLQPCFGEVQLHQQEKGYTATCGLSLTFYDADTDTSLMVRSVGQGADAGDKAMYKAMAGAFKYAVFTTFCVPEDGADAEFSEPEVKPRAAKSEAKPVTAPGPKITRDILG